MPGEKIRVLYVDVEINELISFKANFGKYYEIFTAVSATEGMDILSKEEIHVIIADHRVPKIKGVDFLESVNKKYPDAVRMLLTGCSDIEAIIDAINKAYIYKCIRKPWNDDDLRNWIGEGYKLYCRNMNLSQTKKR